MNLEMIAHVREKIILAENLIRILRGILQIDGAMLYLGNAY